MTVYSVGVYKNKNDGMIFMIPFGFDTDGVRTGLDKLNILHNPFDSNAIGNALKNHWILSSMRSTQERIWWILLKR